VLNLQGNRLSRLPDDFGALSRLRLLGLKSNRLVELPPSFSRLGSLVELFLTDNQLTAFPPGAVSSAVCQSTAPLRLIRVTTNFVP
jgi:Leucine-rich repeat (LRR) protein